MGASDVALIVLGLLALALPVVIWGMKQYANTWIRELVKAEVWRQYSLPEESTCDRLRACKTIILVLDEARDILEDGILAARLAIILSMNEEVPYNKMLDALLSKSKLESSFTGAGPNPSDQVIAAILNSFTYSSSLLSCAVKPLRAWLPDNIESLLDSLIEMYRQEQLQKAFKDIGRALREGRLPKNEAWDQFRYIEIDCDNKRSAIERQLKFELKRLVGVETPNRQLV